MAGVLPADLWRAASHPLRMMKRSENELKLPADDQFKDVISPPIFLLLTVLAAHVFEIVVVGNSPIIDNGIGLASLIQDNTSLILFRLIAFATLPVIAAAFGVARRVSRWTGSRSSHCSMLNASRRRRSCSCAASPLPFRACRRTPPTKPRMPC